MPGASRSYFEAANVESNLLSQHEEIIMVTNMGPDGKPAKENASLGSGEVVWHSDNSYIEEPPIGSFLRSLVLPEDGGNTSFSNQYLAYETLPSDVKAKIAGLYTKQDASRNSAGKLRPGLKAPTEFGGGPRPESSFGKTSSNFAKIGPLSRPQTRVSIAIYNWMEPRRE